MILTIKYLIILYFISMCFMTIFVFRNIKKNPNKYFFNIVQCMYVLIYAVEPFLVHFYMNHHVTLSKSLYWVLEYDSFNIRYFYYFLLFSWIGFFWLQFGNNLKLYKKNENLQIKSKGHTYNVWMLTAIVTLVIGIIAEFFWSYVYGGPIAIIQYASLLRDNVDTGIENPYTLFFRFAGLVRFANIIFVALACYYKRWIPFLFAVISLFFSIIYLLATDGRASFVMHLLSVGLVAYISLRKVSLKLKLKHMIFLPIIGIGTLGFIHNGEFISKILSGGVIHEYATFSFDILGDIRDEFSFTVRNEQAIFAYLRDYPYAFRFPSEVFAGVLGVLPTSFRPKNFEMLGAINTRYWWPHGNQLYIGERPPDLLVTGIYTFNWLGVFVLPFLLGLILCFLDRKRLQMPTLDGNIFFAVLFYPVIRVVTYSNFNNITAGLFSVLLGYILLLICKFFINNFLVFKNK